MLVGFYIILNKNSFFYKDLGLYITSMIYTNSHTLIQI
jgi:hypothetical protein